MTREEFLRDFHSRTLALAPGIGATQAPLIIVLDTSVHCPAGHVLVLSLVNQVARLHPWLLFVGDLDQPLQCRDIFGLGSVRGATLGLARSINPFIRVGHAPAVPTNARGLTIGLGNVPAADVQIGFAGWLALFGQGAIIEARPESAWGAMLAACIATNLVFHHMLGSDEELVGSFSLWDSGRRTDLQGPRTTGPVEVGRVLQVGVGAVGAALSFFLSFVGVGGEWVIVDADAVSISNLNRQLLYRAADAGYPDGTPVNKAVRAAGLLGTVTRFSPDWYGVEEDIVEAQYDVVLPLADEKEVRRALQLREGQLLLHATTSPNHQAQLHRHFRGRDDCIVCRLPSRPSEPRFICSTPTVELSSGESFEAAAPHLSALAGLLLAAELVRLQQGLVLEDDENFTSVDLFRPEPHVARRVFHCHDGCELAARLGRLEPGALEEGQR